MLKFTSFLAQHILALTFGLLASVSPCLAMAGNFELEARVQVAWDPDGTTLVANGHRNTLGDLSVEDRRPVFIDHGRGIIAINGEKYFQRNLTSGDVVLLLGIDANLSSPMRESEYLEKNYVTSIFGFSKIYVAPPGSGWQSSQYSYIIPNGRRYFLVQYSDIVAHSFVISVFSPLDNILEINPEPIEPGEEKDGLEFTLEEIEEINRQIEEEKAQQAALDELGLEPGGDENLVIENDQMMLVACAAEHDACELDTDPEDIRRFMKLSSRTEAEKALREEVAKQSGQ